MLLFTTGFGRQAAEVASMGRADQKEALLEYLRSEYPEIRFWGASGLTTLAQRGEIETAPELLTRRLKTTIRTSLLLPPKPSVILATANGAWRFSTAI